jgi:carbon starvation protein CstA
MAYSLYTLFMVGLPTVALILATRRKLGLRWVLAIPVVAVFFIYSAPLLNYLNAAHFYRIPQGAALGLEAGYAPVEAYLFILLHGIFTTLCALWVWRRTASDDFTTDESG